MTNVENAEVEDGRPREEEETPVGFRECELKEFLHVFFLLFVSSLRNIHSIQCSIDEHS